MNKKGAWENRECPHGIGKERMQKKFSESASAYVKLTYDPKSKKHYGRCPFCGSKVEGFSISDRNNTFYCYVCGGKGSRSDFYSKLFWTRPVRPVTEHVKYSEIYEEAAEFYYRNLKCKDIPALRYLSERGISDAVIDMFGLGYSPNSYAALYDHLKERYPDEEILSSGLVKEKGNGFKYDFFRNRIMFPILGQDGRVIAFGARAIGDELPKYLNSGENEAFSKRTILYSYPYEKKERARSIIVCEGYMDVIAMQSSGILDSCAVLGTALTPEHALLISANYKNVVLCLDSDPAGIHAAKKSIDLLKAYGLGVTIPNLLPAKDPDEFIRKYGISEFRKRLLGSVDAEIFLMRHSTASEMVDILLKRA